ncbi:uncharacterized protein [Ptychodera flava]|uniref:uncharacterized protein n=1 Tax=Ptychodera flava TaxID=63121 RepID=UPI00396A2DAB
MQAMAGVVAGGSRESGDGLKRKHSTGGGDTDDDDDDDDDDKKNNAVQVIEKKAPRLDLGLNSSAVLILLERWGSPIHGGIAAALYELIDQLKSCGHIIHCTVLEADGKTEREAERLGINLILPERNSLFEKEKPSHFWLAAHKIFYPHLKDIPDLRFIFGFGIVSSSVAVHIKDKVLPDAEYIHVNVWNPEELTKEMFPYDEEVFDHRCECLDEQSLRAFVVLSIGPKIFDHFEHTYHDPSTEHLQLVPLPTEDFFNLPWPVPPKLPNSRNFRIMTPFDKFTVSELNNCAIVPRALTMVAKLYESLRSEPPKWEILCMNKHDDKEIQARLKFHPKLTVIIKGFQNGSIRKELLQSHLVVFPPRAINSLRLVVDTIASGKPILVPTASDGDEFISKYFPRYREDVVVEMRGDPGMLKDRLTLIVQDYSVYLKVASEMQKIMKTTVIKELRKKNSVFLKSIEEHLRRTALRQATQCDQFPNLIERDDSQPSTSASSVLTEQPSPNPEREPCTIGVQVGTSQGHAVNGASMLNVDDGFNQREGNRPTTEGMGRVLSDVHNGLEVTKVDRGCLRYVMKCRSLEALEALWSEYISGRLDKTIHSTIITPTLLSKIQAHYLTLDIYIPVQEYLLCKREIPLLTGSVPTPSRRRSVAAITELKSAPREDITRHHTVDSLNLLLSRMQIRDNQTISELLSRDDFSVEELQGHRSTFVTKQWKVKPDVYFKEAKFRQFQRTRDELRMTLNSETSSFHEADDDKVTEFVQLKIHASKHSAHSKAVLHEAGQKLMMQREDITNQATPLKEKSEARKTLIDELQSDVERATQGYPVKESVLEVFGKGSMPGQFNDAEGIYIKNNGQWVICDWGNHRVQVIDPIKLCCDLILQFHAFPKSFNPWNVTVDEDNDQYFMSDKGNGQVVVSSGQSKILNCFGRKEGINPTGICLSPDGFIFIGDWNGYVRKYNKSGEHIARTEKGQVSQPWDLIVNKKWIFVSDSDRKCVHVLNHQMQSIRDIGKGHLEWPMGLCFDHQQDGIYVCDFSGHRVVHFNCDGEFLSYKGQGQLEKPRYIALCKDNPYRLVVTQNTVLNYCTYKQT